MKKSCLLLTLLTVLSLSSCTESISNSGTSDSSEITSIEETTTTEESSETTTESTDETSESESGETSVIEDNIFSVPSDFASVFNAGEQFQNESNLTNLIHAIDPEELILSSVAVNKCSVQEHSIQNGPTYKDFTIGTGSSSGEFVLNTSTPIKSVTFEFQVYSKWIEYSQMYSIDESALVTINDVSKTINSGDGLNNPIETFNVQFDIPTNKISIKNDEQKHRVFIKSMTFIY